jgi:hypothetical protein
MNSAGNPHAKGALLKILDQIHRHGHFGNHKSWEILVELVADYEGMIVTDYDDFSCDSDIEDLLRRHSIAAKKDPWDYLGEIFEEINLSSQRSGQFFTPRNVCTFMAKMTLPDKITKIQTILEPALGTGRMLLAVNEVFPDAPLIFFGVEIDLWLYRAAMVNMKMFSKHPYGIICANSLMMGEMGPASPCWDLSSYWTGTKYQHKWEPEDMSPFYFKAKPEAQRSLLDANISSVPTSRRKKIKKVQNKEIVDDEEQNVLTFSESY